MTDKLLIDRELLEHMRNFTVMHDSGVAGVLRGQIDAILANPTQHGEEVEVVAYYWLDTAYENPNKHGPYFGWPSEDALRNIDGAMPIALCRLSDHQRILADVCLQRDKMAGLLDLAVTEAGKTITPELRERIDTTLSELTP